jgi:hypothetical protein
MDDQKQLQQHKVEEDDLRWRRLLNSSKAANLDLCEREREEGCRNSLLHQLAATHFAATNRALQAVAPKVVSEEDQRRIDMETAMAKMLQDDISSACGPQASFVVDSSVVPSSKHLLLKRPGGHVRKIRSALNTYQRMPNISSSSVYCATIGTIALEKERAYKLHAVAHARQELLSIGVVEDKVEQLFDGEINMQSLLELCEDAARQAAQEVDDGSFMKNLAAIVGAPRPSMVVASPSKVGPTTSTAAARSVTPQLSTRSIERALTPTAQHAMTRGDHRLPIGREVQRVFRKIQERTVKQSAQSFDYVQSSKRLAHSKTEEIIAKFEREFRESINKQMASVKPLATTVH